MWLSSEEKPSMARFKSDSQSKASCIPTNAANSDRLVDVDFQFRPSVNNLSPIAPIRLSQLFENEVDKVQCLQYVSARLIRSPESPMEQVDKVQCSQYVSARLVRSPESPMEQLVSMSSFFISILPSFMKIIFLISFS